MEKVGFGGGCHWCTEGFFKALKGVQRVEQGWISSVEPYDAFSEAIIVRFNKEITLKVLIEVHLLTHSSTNSHSMRDKYRSAVYYFDINDKILIESIIEKLAVKNNTGYITQVLPFVDFRLNSEHYLNYYGKNKDSPFCKTHIDPKLNVIRREFGQHVRGDSKIGKNGQNVR